jgi:hypothetical protein
VLVCCEEGEEPVVGVFANSPAVSVWWVDERSKEDQRIHGEVTELAVGAKSII